MSTITPINRYTEKVIENDGTKAYKVYNMASPHYYMDKTGSYHSVDITNLQTITKDTVGEIKLREKNIVSTGLRTDGNKTKYLGLRPDNTQEDGTQQLEWTIEEAIINNVTQSITLNQTSSIDGVTTNLGGQVVQSTRNYTRQMVPVTGSINNFQIKYKLHLTGLQISNSKDNGTDYYTSDNGYFKITDTDNNTKFQISLPVLLDSNFEEVTSDTIHTLKDNRDGTYEYIKYPSNNLLSSGISSSVAYIDSTTIYPSLDGQVSLSSFSSWDVNHDGSTGTAAATAQSDEFGVSYLFELIKRLFLSFDTSDIEITPTSAKLSLYTTGVSQTGTGIVIEATHTEIASSTFNDFTGWGSGWDDSDVTAYSDAHSSWSANTRRDMTLNSTALAAVANNETFKVCVMNHTHDYLDVDTGAGEVENVYVYLSEKSGTDKDPYLYVVEASVLKTKVHILSGQTKILGGQVTIK